MPESTEKFVNQAGLAHYTGIIKNHTDLSLQVDDVTIEYSGSMNDDKNKLRIKDAGITQPKLSLALQITLGIADISTITDVDSIVELIQSSDVDQQEFILQNISSSTVSSWTVSQVETVTAAFDQSLRASFVADKVSISGYSMAEIKSFIQHSVSNGYSSGLIGKSKNLSITGYGSKEFKIIGIQHDDLPSGGKSLATFLCIDALTVDQIDTRSSTNHNERYFPNCNLANKLNTTYKAMFPQDVLSLMVTVSKKCLTGQNDTGDLPYNSYDADVWILSFKEMGINPNKVKSANFPSRGYTDGEEYQYFAEGGSLPTYSGTVPSIGTSNGAWTRTPAISNNNLIFGTYKPNNLSGASNYRWICPGFCI